MFHVPLSRSGDAGARAEDQHRFIVPERCQSPAPHDGLTLRPRQHIQSKKVVKIPTSLLGVPGHGPYGHTWLCHNSLQIIKNTRYKLPKRSGVSPSGQGREASQARNDGGTPELLATAYTGKKYFVTSFMIDAIPKRR